MKKLIFLVILLVCVSVNSQKKYKDLKSEYNTQVECLGTGVEGVQVLKVYSFKKRRKVKQKDYAKIKRGAIFTVIFNGIPGVPSNGCETQPGILEEDDYEKNQSYFDNFFKGGKFSQYISLSSQSSMDVIKMGKGYEISMNVTVRRDALAKKLKADGIATGLKNIFD
jgi:hypothetical protein